MSARGLEPARTDAPLVDEVVAADPVLEPPPPAVVGLPPEVVLAAAPLDAEADVKVAELIVLFRLIGIPVPKLLLAPGVVVTTTTAVALGVAVAVKLTSEEL